MISFNSFSFESILVILPSGDSIIYFKNSFYSFVFIWLESFKRHSKLSFYCAYLIANSNKAKSWIISVLLPTSNIITSKFYGIRVNLERTLNNLLVVSFIIYFELKNILKRLLNIFYNKALIRAYNKAI